MVEARLWAELPGFNSRRGIDGTFFFNTASRLVLGNPSLLSLGYWVLFPQG